jgi:uncharacterized coiled-coil protein SlyX
MFKGIANIVIASVILLCNAEVSRQDIEIKQTQDRFDILTNKLQEEKS